MRQRRELSIRLALGASRWDVIRQLGVEAALLSAAGAAGGLLLAQAVLDVLKAFAPADVPRIDQVGIALPAVLFAVAVLVAVTFVVGLAPALVALHIRALDGLTARSSPRFLGRSRSVASRIFP